MREARAGSKELPRPEQPLFVSVNVSSRQLFRPELINEVRHILGRAVMPPRDRCGSRSPKVAGDGEPGEGHRWCWSSCAAAGARLSLDDFGTGYSSLVLSEPVLLRHHQDRPRVRAGERPDGSGSAILRSIVALAHELGKKVVAEGVERAEDVAFLRSIGCEYAQGFYYGEPMAEREIMSMLRVIRKSERKLQRRGYFRAKPKRVDTTPEVGWHEACRVAAGSAPRRQVRAIEEAGRGVGLAAGHGG